MKLVSLENLSKYNELLNQKTVRSVNSVKPDSNGNVQLGTEKSTFNKVEYDTGYFSISSSKTYKFDMTGSDLENVSKENVNIRLVAKVTTAHNSFAVGDIAQISTAFDVIDKISSVDVCAFINGNTLHIRSGGDSRLSIHNGTSGGWLEKANVQIKAVLTAFIPSDGSILLIAEDQDNTSKLIGLPDGTLTWKDKNLVRSVNGVNADESGNVSITSVKYATSADSATKAIQDANGAQIDTTYFKSANGTFTGREYFRAVNDDVLRFNGGNTHDGGASLMLFGKNSQYPGHFDLVACTKEDASDSKQLVGTPAGSLTWHGYEVERVNSVGPNYIRYESGLQFCFGSANSTNPNVSFPKPFSHPPITLCSGSGNQHGWGTSNMSSTGFTVINSNGGQEQYCYFFAIGYWK